jgi:radical SAM superfamily enzyme YgiQ (UPF0313 family)
MVDVLLMTPRELSAGLPSLNNQNVLVTDEEYARLGPVMRGFYQKVRENLGLACISAQLRADGHSVLALNLHGRLPSDEAIMELVRREQPRMVGISVMYDLHIPDAVRLIRCVRRACPASFVAIGGAFCTYNAKMLVESLPDADCVSFGEGERTVSELVATLAAGADWRKVPGLWYRGADGLGRSSGMPRLPDLTTLPWPARDVLSRYREAGVPTPVASTYTSRGCHAKCTFCYAPRAPGAQQEGRWRVRPPEDVVDEIEWLQRDFGTRFVWFNDDNFGGAFADGKAHALAFAEEVLRRKLRFSFHAEFRVDSGLLDHDSLDLLHRAGMASALLGMESGSPSVLKRFKKGTTVPYNFAAAELFKKRGLGLDPGWIMIEPGSTLDNLWENLHFIVATGVHRSDDPFFLINRAIALRGTEMYDRVELPLIPLAKHFGGEHLLGGDSKNLGGDSEESAARVLGAARRNYRVADPRIEALWEAWSRIGGAIGDFKENRLPFLGQAMADAARASDPSARAEYRARLTQMRRWRIGLPELFVAFLNLSLVLADQDPPDLPEQLDCQLRALVDAYDRKHLGEPFDRFARTVEDTAEVAVPAAAGVLVTR